MPRSIFDHEALISVVSLSCGFIVEMFHPTCRKWSSGHRYPEKFYAGHIRHGSDGFENASHGWANSDQNHQG